jgi:hypothetical protein
MVDKVTTDSVWVTVKEAAEITGYTPGWMTKWVRDMLGIPADDRPIQVREHAGRYELWLPDLVDYVAEYAAGRLNQEPEEIWVNVTEGTEITGYNRDHVLKLARDNWNMPEDQRLIRIRKRSHGYDIWLPDLMRYINRNGHGPYQKASREIVDNNK